VRTTAVTLRTAALPRAGLLADSVFIAAGAALIALSAQISIPLPFTPVPITGQTFAVLLVGASLGALCGGASAVLYVCLGIVGIPVYADGTHGWAQLTSATGGYLIGFVLAAIVTGLLAERRWDRRFSSAIGAMLTGSVVIYLCGLTWLAHELGTGLTKTLELGLYPFVPGDLFKLYVAAAALPLAWRFIGRPRRRWQ
jgi:biotin transport system substrate-specific component